MYKFLEDYTAKGNYVVPLYDEFPDMGSYSRNIEKVYKAGNILDAEMIGTKMIRLNESSYGETYLFMNIEELVKTKVLHKMSHDEIAQEMKVYEAKAVYDNALRELHQIEEYLEEYSDEITKNTIDNYDLCIRNFIHAKADYIIANI